MSQCTAKSKRTHERCQRPAMHGSNVCYHHGGKTPRGIASPNYKHGKSTRWDRSIPAALLEKYHASVNDPELLNMRADISLLDSRLSQLLQRVDTKQSKSVFEDTRKCHDKILRSMTNEDYGGVIVALGELDRAIGTGLADYDAWNEVASLIEQRRKLVESEQKRLVAMNQMINAQQAMSLIAAIASIVKTHVTDRKVLSLVQNDLTRLITVPAQVEAHETVDV